MAFLKLYRKRLQHNYAFLQKTFEEHKVDWGVVTKLLCGNKLYLEEIINLGVTEIHDSRIRNLKIIKQINPAVQTVYIKPPAKRSVDKVIKYADVSFNTEYYTIKRLSDAAVAQNKHHKIIIMVEMGDLREGIMGEDLVSFYEKVFDLPGISIIGLGTNLNCLNGVMPSTDKLIQLSLYKELIETKFNKKIPWVSGGTSVTVPLLFKKQLPKGVNHFRVGETLFFGKNLFAGKAINGMEPSTIELFAEIIELIEKPVLPIGELGMNPSGEVAEIDANLYGKKAHRAIIDVGLLDIDPKFLISKNENVKIVGASSDMLVIDLGPNAKNYKTGDLIGFRLEYMGALRLLNSDYIEKRVE